MTHGGILSTYFDEVLWHATRVQNPGTVAMTVEMTVHYMKPVHPGGKPSQLLVCPQKFRDVMFM